MVSPAAHKPEGGFVFISVLQLCMAWWAYRQRLIRLIDLRVWFAAHELVARRCQLKPGQQPSYTREELYRLVGRGGGIPASLQRLKAAGLLCWAAHQLSFPDAPAPERAGAGLWAMLAQIRNQRRLVPVPRRVLRFLAGGGRRAIVATVLGHLFRCLYYRHGQCWPEGFCKASWVAQVFGVSLRTVKTARQELETLGLLQRIEVPQWVLNRYGQKMALNLHWELPPPSLLAPVTPQVGTSPASLIVPPTPCAGSPLSHVPAQPAPPGLTPPAEFSTLGFAPLDHTRNSLTREEYQKPVAGPAGVLTALFEQAREAVREGTALLDDPEPIVVRTVSAPRQQNTPPAPEDAPAALPAPTLRNIVPQDLRDTGRLLVLYDQAVQQGLISACDAERLTFVALACHVLLYRPQNAGGLFHWLITHRLYHFVTQDDEDAALQRLKRHLYGEREVVLRCA